MINMSSRAGHWLAVLALATAAAHAQNPLDGKPKLMLTLEALLMPFGFDPTKLTKLVRHQDRRFDLERLYRTGDFEFYQSMQRRSVFGSCEQVVSFMGRPGTHAVFVGLYRLLGVTGRQFIRFRQTFRILRWRLLRIIGVTWCGTSVMTTCAGGS